MIRRVEEADDEESGEEPMTERVEVMNGVVDRGGGLKGGEKERK